MSIYVPMLTAKTLKLLLAVFAAVAMLTVAIPRGECFQNTNALITDQSESTRSYVVQEGDTLYGIAGYYQVAVAVLMQENHLNSSLILPGQELVVPAVLLSEEVFLSRGGITVSREDLMLIARLIHAEARGESFEGQVAVGAVILNRLESPHFPQSIREVIYQRNSRVCQFSPVGDGSINLEPGEQSVQAAWQALQGKDPTGGALFFYNPNLSKDQWIRTLPVMTRIGNHVFASVAI